MARAATAADLRALRRLGRTRDEGMRASGRLTRRVIGAALALAAAFSALSAAAFPGRSGTRTSGTSTTASSSDPQVVALPPRNGGEALAPPAAPIVSSGGGGSAPVAVSGGS